MVKRASGGGRKPKGEFSKLSSTLTIRIPDDMRRRLESEAAEKNESMAQRLMWHLRQSFNRELENRRDPALRGLLYMIGHLADQFGKYSARLPEEKEIYESETQRHQRIFSMPEEGDQDESDLDLQPESQWRTDWRAFRAFKVAVGKLFATLEEPPISAWFPLTEKQRKKVIEGMVKAGDPRSLAKASVAHRFKPAEEWGEEEFSYLLQEVQTRPLTTELRELHRRYPEFEREFYTLPKAWKAVQLDPKREKLEIDSLKKLRSNSKSQRSRGKRK
jgi:hypothetical protein